MASSRVLAQRFFAVLSTSRLSISSSKRHVSVRAWSPRSSTAPQTPTVPAAAKASTRVEGTNNPELIEEFPTTAAEIQETSQEPNGNGNGAPPVTPFSELAEPSSLNDATSTDWSKSYFGLSSQAFSKEIADILLAPIDPLDVEMKPDGLIYLPEIKYRRVLNRAFGPGGWGLAPRSQTNVGPKIVSREYALVCQGRLVAIARGEQEYFDPHGIPTATEACKSNALMRCCKDLGVASELWDPRFIREFKAKHCVEVFVEHLSTKKKKKLWRRRDQPKFEYPYKE